MKYFRTGGFAYGTVYTAVQGLRYIRRVLSTFVHRNAVSSCGTGSVFYEGVFIAEPKNVQIGAHCLIGRNVMLGTEIPSATCTLHDNVQINAYSHIDFSGDLVIGAGALISSQVTILTHDHGLDPHSAPIGNGLLIENSAWIGTGATIMQSVKTIGANSIIAAGSVVTKDVPPNTVVGGNPARVIRGLEPEQ